MKISLRQVTCNDEKAYNSVISYMLKIGEYRNFDETMPIAVYVNDDYDLIGFESLKYRIQFVNNAHKLYEVANTNVSVDPVPYKDFKDHMLCIGADLPF